jgi:hypothetical protein
MALAAADGARFGARFWLNPKSIPLCLGLVLSIALSGCSTTSISDFVTNDADDSCHDQRAALRSYGDYFAQDMMIGGAVGAATGGLAGVVTHQSVGTTVGMAAAGLAIGAAGGYWVALSQKNSDMAARSRQVATDTRAENAKIDGAQLAFNRLMNCRRGQATQLRTDVKAGKVAQADGDKQMDRIRARFDDDIALGKKIGANIASHSADLEFANEQLKPQPYIVKHSAPIYASQDQGAAHLETMRDGAIVSGAAVNSTWVKVTLSRGRSGYMLASDVDLEAAEVAANPKRRKNPPDAVKGDPVSEGVFTNLSKRADYDDSVQVASTNTSGFELSGG